MFPNNAYQQPMGNNPFATQPQYGQVQPPNMPQLNNMFQQMQQATAPQAQTPLIGRVIKDISELTANDTPQDGKIALFPMRDYSTIFARQLNPDYSVTEIKYVPEQPQASTDDNEQSALPADLMNQLSNIEDLLNQVLQNQKAQPRSNHPKQKYSKYNAERKADTEVSE